MKKTTITALLLLSALLLAACGETAAQTPSDTEKADAETTAPVTEDPRIPSGLPDTDLGGFVMTMYQSSSHFTETGAYSEAMDGDIVNDAVYERNRGVMEKYNCVIEQSLTADKYAMDTLKTFILAGDDTVDLAFICGDKITGNMQYFYDLTTLQYFDFNQPWWRSEFNDSVMLNGHLYFTIGAYMLSARGGLFGVLVNKDLAKNYDIDVNEMYQAARDGTWTLDMFSTYAKMVSSDTNGDGVQNESDTWGIIGQNYSNWALALGAGFKCVIKDADGIPVNNFGCEKNVQIMDKVMGITGDQSLCLFAQQMKTKDVWTTYTDMTTNGQFLFNLKPVNGEMRAYEYDFGFLPTPKYSEDQESYFHDGSIGNKRMMAIPKTCSDADSTAFIVEALSYSSYYDVLPSYYENYLNTKILRDEASIEMLQIVEDSIYYDCGALFNWGSMRHTIEDMVKTNTLASKAASKENSINSAIEATLALMNEDT